MAVHPLSSYDLDSIQSVEDALLHIERNLDSLIDMTKTPVTKEDRPVMTSNIKFVKRYYERAELLLMRVPL